MRTARPAISGNQLASIGEFECRNFSNFRLCHAIFSICSICSNIERFKTVLEHVLTLLIQKTATFSKCNGVFFGVKICTIELRKSNILAPKHGGDGVIIGFSHLVGVRRPYYSGQWFGITDKNRPRPDAYVSCDRYTIAGYLSSEQARQVQSLLGQWSYFS